MPPRLIQLQAAADMLGLTADELNDFRSQNEIFGYRDGATWKFKLEEIERFAQARGLHVSSESARRPEGGSGIDAELEHLIDVSDLDTEEGSSEESSSPGDMGSILVSEETLGKSGGGTASTIIGKSGGTVCRRQRHPTGGRRRKRRRQRRGTHSRGRPAWRRREAEGGRERRAYRPCGPQRTVRHRRSGWRARQRSGPRRERAGAGRRPVTRRG